MALTSTCASSQLPVPESISNPATVDQRGSFHLEAPEPGLFQLVVNAPGAPPLEKVLPPLFRSQDLGPLTMGVAQAPSSPAPQAAASAAAVRPLHVIGRILDSATRQPLVGAWVWAANDIRCFARTQRDGRFVLSLPHGSSPTLVAAISGYQSGAAQLPAGLSADPVTIFLKPASAVLLGLVVDDQGKPVSGARVTLPFVDSEPHSIASTDERGLFRFEGLPAAEEQEVRVSKTGYSEASLSVLPGDGSVRKTITLSRLRAVRGEVFSDRGAPIPGAAVKLLRGQVEVTAGVTTDDGSFILGPLEVGLYTLVVVAEGFAAETRPLRVPEADGHMEPEAVRLEPEARLTGVIRGAGGEPLEGCRIYVGRGLREDAAEPGGEVRRLAEGVTLADGTFTLRHLALERGIELQVWREGYLPARWNLLPSQQREPLVLQLEPAITLLAQVRDGDGRPVPRAQVRPTQLQHPWLPKGTLRDQRADAEGTVSIHHLRPGPLKLELSAPGYGTTTETVDVPGGRPRVEVVLTLPRQAILEGTVRDQAGRPLVGAQLVYRPAGETAFGSFNRYASSDESGGFVMGDLAPGGGSLEVTLEGHRTERRLVSLASGEQREDFYLKPGDTETFRVTGRLVGPSHLLAGNELAPLVQINGRPGGALTARDGSGQQRGFALLKAGGERLTLNRLSRGSWLFEAEAIFTGVKQSQRFNCLGGEELEAVFELGPKEES